MAKAVKKSSSIEVFRENKFSANFAKKYEFSHSTDQSCYRRFTDFLVFLILTIVIIAVATTVLSIVLPFLIAVIALFLIGATLVVLGSDITVFFDGQLGTDSTGSRDHEKYAWSAHVSMDTRPPGTEFLLAAIVPSLIYLTYFLWDFELWAKWYYQYMEGWDIAQ